MARRKTPAVPPKGAIQLVQCEVALGGDEGNKAMFDLDNPVTFPEALVLEQKHFVTEGSRNPISGLKHLGYVQRTPKAEKARLRAKYGPIVDALFPGLDPSASMTTVNPNGAPAPGLECVTGAFAKKAAPLPETKPEPDPEPGYEEAVAEDADADDGGYVPA